MLRDKFFDDFDNLPTERDRNEVRDKVLYRTRRTYEWFRKSRENGFFAKVKDKKKADNIIARKMKSIELELQNISPIQKS